MKKLLILLCLFPLFADAQNFGNGDSIYLRQYGNGSNYAQIYVRSGYNRSFNNNACIIFLAGAGERGTGATDSGRIDNAAIPRYLKSQSYRLAPNMICISPQITTGQSQYLPTITQLAVNMAINTYGVNPNKILFAGHSLGASGIPLLAWYNPDLIAAALPVAGAMITVNPYVFNPAAMAEIPWLFVGDNDDNTQNLSNSVKALDSLWAINSSVTYLPESDFIFGGSHGNAADRVFGPANFPRYLNWLLLHDKRFDSTVLHYCDSVTRGFDDAFYRKALRLANKLSASSFKTAQLLKLSTAYAAQYGAGKEYNANLQSTAATVAAGYNGISNNTTGASINNLIATDGSPSSIGFQVVSNGQTVKRAYTTDLTGYFGMPNNVLNDGFQMNQNPGRYRFTNLDNASLYDVQVFWHKRERSSSLNFTANVVVQGRTAQSTGWQYYNTSRYVWEKNIAPVSGAIDISVTGVATNSEVVVSNIRLIKHVPTGGGNLPPTVDAGLDQTITLPTSSVTLNGTSSDADGTIVLRAWTRSSGPGSVTILSPGTNTTVVNGLTEGNHVFQLEITDDDGATSVDNVLVTVNPAANQPPTAYAGIDKSITLPTDSVSVTGTASDADGTFIRAWSQINGPATVTFSLPSGATTVIRNLVTAGAYTIRLTVTDNKGAVAFDDMVVTVSGGAALQISAGADLRVFMDQGGNQAPVKLTGQIVSGTPTSWSWSVWKGPSLTITGGTTQTPTFSGFPMVDTVYGIRVSATNGVNTSVDSMTIKVFDAHTKWAIPCNPNTVKNVFMQGVTAGNEIYIPYAKRDNRWPNIQGGDTVFILPNPNNGGVISRMEIGGINAPKECPIHILPYNAVVKIGQPSNTTAAINFGNRDSAVTGGIDFDGTWMYASRGIAYGWEVIRNGGFGFGAPLVFNSSFKGMYIFNTKTGTSLKSISDSTKPYFIFDNFRNKNIELAYNYIDSTATEGAYIGTTDPAGLGQGNDGPPVRGDSLYVHHSVYMNCGWDGLQASAFGYTRYQHNLIANTGLLGVASQNASAFTGGFTTQFADSNYHVNSYGGPQILGEGVSYFINNVVDGARLMYVRQAQVTGYPQDTMQNFIQRNVWRGHIGTEPWIKIQFGTSAERFKGGSVKWNIFEDTRPINQVVTTQYGDTVTGNVINAAVNLDTSALAQSLPAVKLYDLIRNVPGRHSFFDLTPPEPNQPPVMNAGAAQEITAPASSVTLTGSGSDIDGTLAAYAWVKLSGGAATITSPSSATTTVTGLVPGSYVFQLTGTDNDGATATATVSVLVKPNTPPTADAGGIVLITIPPATIDLAVSGSDDGSIVSYLWSFISGPNTPVITGGTTPTPTISNLVAGTYTIRLTVTDNGGLTAFSNATIIVTPAYVPLQKVRLRGRFIITTP